MRYILHTKQHQQLDFESILMWVDFRFNMLEGRNDDKIGYLGYLNSFLVSNLNFCIKLSM